MIETTTNGQRLLIVPVPKESFDFTITGKFGEYLHYYIPVGKTATIDLKTTKEVEFLGTLHVENGKPVLSEWFDPEPLVERDMPIEGAWYVDYMNPVYNLLEHPVDSFFSLITSAIAKAGYTWGNPLGENIPFPVGIKMDNGTTHTEKVEMLKNRIDRNLAWREAESKAIHKVALIKIEG